MDVPPYWTVGAPSAPYRMLTGESLTWYCLNGIDLFGAYRFILLTVTANPIPQFPRAGELNNPSGSQHQIFSSHYGDCRYWLRPGKILHRCLFFLYFQFNLQYILSGILGFPFAERTCHARHLLSISSSQSPNFSVLPVCWRFTLLNNSLGICPLFWVLYKMQISSDIVSPYLTGQVLKRWNRSMMNALSSSMGFSDPMWRSWFIATLIAVSCITALHVSGVTIVATSTCLDFHANAAIFVHPWPRPGFMCQLQGIVSWAINLNLHFKMGLVAPGRACHQKRVVEFEEYLCEEVLKAVPSPSRRLYEPEATVILSLAYQRSSGDISYTTEACFPICVDVDGSYWKSFQKRDKKPNMIMPAVGGGNTYNRIKENNTKVKVLLSSGYSIYGQTEEILERGCSGFIQKPFDMKEISQKLREILDKDKFWALI